MLISYKHMDYHICIWYYMINVHGTRCQDDQTSRKCFKLPWTQICRNRKKFCSTVKPIDMKEYFRDSSINSATSKCWQQGKEKSILHASNAWQIAIFLQSFFELGKLEASGSETEELYRPLLALNHTRDIWFVKSHSATSLIMHSLFCHFMSWTQWTAYFLKCSSWHFRGFYSDCTL